jgi:hypothetical protein
VVERQGVPCDHCFDPVSPPLGETPGVGAVDHQRAVYVKAWGLTSDDSGEQDKIGRSYGGQWPDEFPCLSPQQGCREGHRVELEEIHEPAFVETPRKRTEPRPDVLAVVNPVIRENEAEIRHLLELANALRKEAGDIAVIVVQRGEELSARTVEKGVVVSAWTEARLIRDIGDTLVTEFFDDKPTLVAIVSDEDLDVGDTLLEDALQSLAEKGGALVGRNDN